MSIALITPTGGRPKQIQLCAEFMRKQDYKGKVLWVLVDDVLPNTVDCVDLVDFRKSWQIVKVFPSPVWSVGQNTQARNLLIGIEIVKNHKDVEAVFIIEDDDYYNPQYLLNRALRFCHLSQGSPQSAAVYIPRYQETLRIPGAQVPITTLDLICHP
jgi:hypothetical protein